MKKLLMILPLVLVLCFAYGCQGEAAKAELKPKSKIEVSQARGLSGHDITVAVTAGGNERITNVRTLYDRKVIGDDSLNPPHSWYKRKFVQVGGNTPSTTHTVLVVVTNTIGKETASLIWTDQ